MAYPFQVIAYPSPREPVDLTPYLASADWTTNAIGGFGSMSIGLPGTPDKWLRQVPKLSFVRATCGDVVCWEGQVEDHTLEFGGEDISTGLQCFGLANLLSEVSTRSIWSKRDLEFKQGQLNLWTPDPAFEVQTGNFDASNLTKSGIRFMGNGQTASITKTNRWRVTAAPGLTLRRVMCTYQKAGNVNLTAQIHSSSDHTTYTVGLNSAAVTTAAVDQALVANAVDVMFSAITGVAFATAVTDFVDYYSVRVLGTSVVEDATGGFYGGTLMRNLISLVPGLTPGNIETGSTFTVESLERSVRDTVLSVVQEVAGYYTHEYAVWENGRFDWAAQNLDDATWVVDLSDLSALNLRSSVDTLSRTDYVLYTDAATGLEQEASATSMIRDNPYFVAGRSKDELVNVGFPMTTNTSAQLATRLNTERGKRPFASGSCSLFWNTPVQSAGEGMLPAYTIRAGDNIKINGLPKDDPFNLGRDGQTLFHITATTAQMDGSMSLSLDSESHAIDALLAKLAAVTRTITG